jgi:hypothetical protein
LSRSKRLFGDRLRPLLISGRLPSRLSLRVTAWYLHSRLFRLGLPYLVHRVASPSCALVAHDGKFSPGDHFCICQKFCWLLGRAGGSLGRLGASRLNETTVASRTRDIALKPPAFRELSRRRLHPLRAHLREGARKSRRCKPINRGAESCRSRSPQ